MSNFECPVVEIDSISEHPNADAIEIAHIGGYNCIVQKNLFIAGDPVVYIPEAAIVPDWLLKEIGLEGKLAGSKKNRVKAIKLRGVLSQGILYPVQTLLSGWEEGLSTRMAVEIVDEIGTSDFVDVEIGDNAAEILGIVKYEPPVPSHMSGMLAKGNYFNLVPRYDFENIKKRKRLIEDGEIVSVTEKIHGTQMVITHYPPAFAQAEGFPDNVVVTSKGLAEKGLVLSLEDEHNVYVKALNDYGLYDKISELGKELPFPISIIGEVYGSIQDLKYGCAKGQNKFAAFEVVAQKSDGTMHYSNAHAFAEITSALDIPTVPVLYVGPFSQAVIDDLTDGPETISGCEAHMREGVVIKPIIERIDPRYGRVIVKSISEKYLLRKNGTEFN